MEDIILKMLTPLVTVLVGCIGFAIAWLKKKLHLDEVMDKLATLQQDSEAYDKMSADIDRLIVDAEQIGFDGEYKKSLVIAKLQKLYPDSYVKIATIIDGIIDSKIALYNKLQAVGQGKDNLQSLATAQA